MRGRLTSNRFVGRASELAELELAADDAADGRPSLVLLGGASGIGKTRLVAELERRLDGMLVLHGDCVEPSEGELPYAPLLGALRPLVRDRHPALSELSAGSRAQLARLLPSLGELPAHREDAQAAGQARLFEALLELLHLLSEVQGVALVLEDMQWGDSSTRTFTAFLARSLRTERVMLLITYRSDELHRRHPLRPLLAELDRLDRARTIELAPFDRDELSEALADILGAEPDMELVERLLARSGGNPLYIEELLAAGLDGRGAAPQSLRDAFMLRIEHLAVDAQAVARVVSAGGRSTERTLEQVTGFERPRLHEALRHALAEHVLVTDVDGRFAFRHELLREALYDDLLPGERGALHLALARALEDQCGVDDDAEVERVTAIATHYAAAGDQSAALRATVAAAIEAERVHAYREVAESAERALELWPRVPDDERISTLDHVELLVLAARGHGGGGDHARGEVLMQRALAEVDPALEPVRYGALLGWLARTQWTLNRGRESLEAGQRALELLSPDPAGAADRAALLAWLARTRVLRGRYRDAIADGEEALAAAVAASDAIAESDVLNTLGMARIALGEVDSGVARLHRAAQIARDHGDVAREAYAYANLADSLQLAGRTSESLEIAREGLALTPRRLRGSHDWMTMTVSHIAFQAGEWDTARAHAGPPAEQVIGRHLIFRLLRDAELALGEGAADQAATALDAAEPHVRVSTESQWHGLFGSLRAEALRRDGDLERARAAVAQALDEIETCTDDVMRLASVTAMGLSVEADRAQRARDLGEPKAARDALAHARIHVQRLGAAAQSGGPVERAWREFGQAEVARARGRSDAALWAAAARSWDALGRPYHAALARHREAEALVERGERDTAAAVAGEALERAGALGAGWLEGELRGLAGRARLRLDGQPRQADGTGEVDGTAVDDGDGDPFGLTERERQVLALVAQGATNRQIGASLYMAEKTASVHVSRILAKLGVSSRTQAAAVAHRQHLA
jgi:DNA-binding CsgD family transcriptional regulator/tetratricopeptide (TPR) repeat protein